jgi:pyruvate,water dikinase
VTIGVVSLSHRWKKGYKQGNEGRKGMKKVVCVYWLDEVTKDSFLEVGGKNASLGELLHAGIRVPLGFAVTVSNYLKFITEVRIKDRIHEILFDVKPDDASTINDASSRIRELFEKKPVSKDIEEAIRESYTKLCEKTNVSNVPVAVRSSATAEDLPDASFAGQQETYLSVRGFNDILDNILKCWSSLFTPRAISYRIKMGFSHEKVLISVGVQKMVNAKAAGVMFTLNPLNGDPSKIVIEGSWGFGESVVSGLVNPDRFEVDKVAWEINKRVISHKTSECIYDDEKEKVVQREISSNRCDMPCISDDEVIELAKIGKRIEKHYGCSQDIEWAIDKDLGTSENILIVQSRPETVWSHRKKEPVAGWKSALELLMERGITGIKMEP